MSQSNDKYSNPVWKVVGGHKVRVLSTPEEWLELDEDGRHVTFVTVLKRAGREHAPAQREQSAAARGVVHPGLSRHVVRGVHFCGDQNHFFFELFRHVSGTSF